MATVGATRFGATVTAASQNGDFFLPAVWLQGRRHSGGLTTTLGGLLERHVVEL